MLKREPEIYWESPGFLGKIKLEMAENELRFNGRRRDFIKLTMKGFRNSRASILLSPQNIMDLIADLLDASENLFKLVRSKKSSFYWPGIESDEWDY